VVFPVMCVVVHLHAEGVVGALILGPCWEFIFRVCYGVAIDPCAVVMCYDVHEQFPV